MTTFLARGRQSVFVEGEELETYIYIYIYISGVCVCDHVERRRMKQGKKTTLGANVKQYAMMRAVPEKERQELHEAIQYMNESQERLLSTIKRKQKLMGEIPELREKIMPSNSGLGRQDLGGGSGIAGEAGDEGAEET